MRKFVGLAGVAFALAISGAAFAQDDLAGVDPAGQTVTYWHQFSGAQLETITTLIEQFNTTNEYGIIVEPIAQGNYNDIANLMNASIVSGELPNLVAGYANNAAGYYADGAAVDLNMYLNDATWGLTTDEMADFNEALLAFNTPMGVEPEALLAWPHQSSAQVFAYNRTLLSELGYDAFPTTLEEFEAAACAANELTGANGEDIQGYPITTDASAFESWVAANGGSIFDGEQYTFKTPEVTAIFQLYQDLYEGGCGYIPSERFAEQADFSLGLNPFFVTSTAGFTFVIAANNDNGFTGEWDVTTFPTADSENPVLQVFVPSIIMVPSTPEAQLASWLFLEFLVTPEAAAIWSQGSGYFNPVPSSAGLIGESDFASTDLFPYFNTVNTLVNDESITLYNSPNVVSYNGVRGLISEAIANVTSNGQNVEEAAAALEEAANALHAESMAG